MLLLLVRGVEGRELREHRREKVRVALLATIEVTRLQAGRDVALMAVLLTLGGTAIVAGSSHETPSAYATPFGVGLVLAAGRLALRMRALAARVWEAADEAAGAIDTLMTEEDEDHADETAHAR